MNRTLVTLATYNEIDNLPSLVDAIWAAADVDILVIDDNSPDGTGRWCDERAVSEPRLYCLHRSGKSGWARPRSPGCSTPWSRDTTKC